MSLANLTWDKFFVWLQQPSTMWYFVIFSMVVTWLLWNKCHFYKKMIDAGSLDHHDYILKKWKMAYEVFKYITIGLLILMLFRYF